MDSWHILGRLAATFVLSFIFGFERQRSHKPTGFGTFVFVATGACGIAVTAIQLNPTNPLPLLSAVVTGIGFLGAGALIKTGDKIHGFTSAALIWIFAVFGMLMGVGDYVMALVVYQVIWIVVLYDLLLERRGIGAYQKTLVIHTNRIVPQEEIERRLLDSKRLKLVAIEMDKQSDRLSATYSIDAKKEDVDALAERLRETEWFESYKVE